MLQVHLAYVHLGAIAAAQVLDVQHAQCGEFQRRRLAADFIGGQLQRAANFAFDHEGLDARLERARLQLHLGATVVKARLVNFHALVARGVVHLDAGFLGLARFLVVNHNFAGEQLGHAGGVVLHDELLQLDGKRQLLEQHAVRLIENRRARLRTLCDQQIAAECGVALGQTVGIGHLGNQASAVVRGFSAEQHLRAHDQVTVEQAANTDQNDRAVCGDVANLVGRAGLGGQHPTRSGAGIGVALLQLDFPSTGNQQFAESLGLRFGGSGQLTCCFMVKSRQALLANVFLVGAQVRPIFGSVACNTQ